MFEHAYLIPWALAGILMLRLPNPRQRLQMKMREENQRQLDRYERFIAEREAEERERNQTEIPIRYRG